MPIPSLRGSARGYSLRWLRQVPAAQLPGVGIGWVIEMQCGGGHFIAQTRVCSSLPTRTGIGRLALLPMLWR